MKKFLGFAMLIILVGAGMYIFNNSRGTFDTQSNDIVWTEESLLAAADQAEFAIQEMQDTMQSAQDKINAETDPGAKAFYQKQFDKDKKKRISIMNKNEETMKRLRIEAKELGIQLKEEEVKKDLSQANNQKDNKNVKNTRYKKESMTNTNKELGNNVLVDSEPTKETINEPLLSKKLILKTCGDRVCDNGETTSSCPVDCASYESFPGFICGDGICNSNLGEATKNCQTDCG